MFSLSSKATSSSPYDISDGEFVLADLANCGWELVDCVKASNANPVSISIPDEEMRANVCAGDVVKLVFKIDEEESGAEVSERLKVCVTGVHGDATQNTLRYRGALCANPVHTPVRTKSDLRRGDDIYFEPRHIVEIHVHPYHAQHPTYTDAKGKARIDTIVRGEPVYEGRPWSVVKDMLTGNDANDVLQALEFIESANSRFLHALPILIDLASRDSDPKPETEIIAAVTATAILPQFGSPAASRIARVLGQEGLGEVPLNMLVDCISEFKVVPHECKAALERILGNREEKGKLDDRVLTVAESCLAVLREEGET